MLHARRQSKSNLGTDNFDSSVVETAWAYHLQSGAGALMTANQPLLVDVLYKKERRVLNVLIGAWLGACLLLGQAPARAATIPEIVAKAKPAVVEILTRDATGTPKKLGTGFFISPDGLVVTNQHVVEGSDSITAVGINGATFFLEHVVAQPVGEDLALIKSQATQVPFLDLGKSTTAVEGQRVIVIGNPTGLMGTVSDGIISAFRENRSLIQITALFPTAQAVHQ
jgi:S1-C subfamily serine protease